MLSITNSEGKQMADQKLTSKQRRFCELIAAGKTQADAYREAYDSTGTSQTVRNSASKLMQQEYEAERGH